MPIRELFGGAIQAESPEAFDDIRFAIPLLLRGSCVICVAYFGFVL